ncbi:hypothetical protein ACHAXA_011747 [Cyclostephanos tholiformis]|jgi:hypothetical protein|uniref:Uncharacterized protein n=1 Tax=Cyclostephanos tholiformis TaxID=382380 RepID=A0ABD3RXJ5_9STRA
MNDTTTASACLNGRAEHLKLRRHHGVSSSTAIASSLASASRSDCMLDKAECGGVSNSPHHSSSSSSSSSSSYSDDDSEYKKDDDHCSGSPGLGSSMLPPPNSTSSSSSSSLSLSSDRNGHHHYNDPSSSTEFRRVAASLAIPRIAASFAILLVLPYLLWDDHPADWGPLRPYPLIRHGVLVWSSVLQFSAWPVVVATLLAAALSPETIGGGGRMREKGAPDSATVSVLVSVSGSGSTTKDNAAASDNGNGTWHDKISKSWTSMARSNWKMPLFISVVFSLLVVSHMTLQMVAPHLIWNPFIWGCYRVYLPDGISRSFEGACLDGDALPDDMERGGNTGSGNPKSDAVENTFRPRRPLCLSERDWNELSSGQLSPYDPNDVSAVERGLYYLRNESGGLVVNVLARDVVDSIPALRKNMDGIASLFPKYDRDANHREMKNRLSLVIFENDSTDGTREAFLRWSDEESGRSGGPRYTVDVMGCGPRNPDCKLGIVDRYDVPLTTPTASGVGRLGEFRQVLIEYILGKEEYRDFSHMLVLDADLGVSLSPLGLLHTLGLEDGRIARNYVVASSSVQVWPGTLGTITPPYDFSAFRPLEGESNRKVRGLHKKFCELMPAGDRWRNLCDASSPMQLFMIQSANDVVNHRDRPYEVSSAFNGLTMYPLGLIRERGDMARYDAGDDGQRCEHIGFNLSIRKTMYVNPKWKMNLRPERPGGPSGLQAVKTLIYAIVGRPAIVTLLVLSKIFCFYVIVGACWIIFMSVKSLWRLCPEIRGLFLSLGQQVCRGNIRCLFIDVKLGSTAFDMREIREKE